MCQKFSKKVLLKISGNSIAMEKAAKCGSNISPIQELVDVSHILLRLSLVGTHSDLLLLGAEGLLKVLVFLQKGLYTVQGVSQILIQEERLQPQHGSLHFKTNGTEPISSCVQYLSI